MTQPSFDTGPLAQVRIAGDASAPTLVLDRSLAHPPTAVWALLTDAALLPRWAPFTPARSLDAPGDVTLSMLDGSGARIDTQACVIRLQAPQLLDYAWGDDRLTWTLASTGDTSHLQLRHRTQDAALLPKIAAGWHLCLLVAQRLLEGAPIAPIVGLDALQYGWQKLFDAYSLALGAAPLAPPEDRYPVS